MNSLNSLKLNEMLKEYTVDVEWVRYCRQNHSEIAGIIRKINQLQKIVVFKCENNIFSMFTTDSYDYKRNPEGKNIKSGTKPLDILQSILHEEEMKIYIEIKRLFYKCKIVKY